MKCLLCYEWVKLPRNNLPLGKGVMGAWAKLAARVQKNEEKSSPCIYVTTEILYNTRSSELNSPRRPLFCLQQMNILVFARILCYNKL